MIPWFLAEHPLLTGYRQKLRVTVDAESGSRGLGGLGAVCVAFLGHALVFYHVANRLESPRFQYATPLPSIDIQFAAPVNRPLPPPPDTPVPVTVARQARTATVPVKKTQSRPRPSKPILTQEAVVKPTQEPASASAPALAETPTQQPALPPPPPEFTPAHANAEYLDNPGLEYPSMARSRRWEGEVTLKVFVREDGSCGDLSVERSSGHEVLDQAALEAVKNWRFVPAKQGGGAVASWVTVPIGFKLGN